MSNDRLWRRKHLKKISCTNKSYVENKSYDEDICCDNGERDQESHGFTLLEVLLTVLILGIILAQVVPKYGSSVRYTQDQTQKANVLRIEGAVELYRLDTGTFPAQLEDLRSKPAAVPGWRGPYLDPIPTQPDGRPYTLNAQGKVEF